MTDTHDLYIAVESNYKMLDGPNMYRTDKAIAGTGEETLERRGGTKPDFEHKEEKEEEDQDKEMTYT